MKDSLKRLIIVLVIAVFIGCAYFALEDKETFKDFNNFQVWISVQIILTVVFLIVILFEDICWKDESFGCLFVVTFILWELSAVGGFILYLYGAIKDFKAIQWWIHLILIAFYLLSFLLVYFIVANFKNYKEVEEPQPLI